MGAQLKQLSFDEERAREKEREAEKTRLSAENQAFLKRDETRQGEIKAGYALADAAGRVPAAYQASIADIDKGAASARSQAVRSGAEGFASALGQAGLPAGGGAAASVRQAAMDRSQQFQNIESQRAQMAGQQRIGGAQAGVDAASAQLAARTFEQEAGDKYLDLQTATLEYENLIQGIIKQYSGSELGGDDGSAMWAAIGALIQPGMDPELVKFLRKRQWQVAKDA